VAKGHPWDSGVRGLFSFIGSLLTFLEEFEKTVEMFVMLMDCGVGDWFLFTSLEVF